MDGTKIDAVEVDDFILLVIHFRRAAQQLRTRRSEIGAAAGRRVVAAAGS